jgi:hypothetical protein
MLWGDNLGNLTAIRTMVTITVESRAILFLPLTKTGHCGARAAAAVLKKTLLVNGGITSRLLHDLAILPAFSPHLSICLNLIFCRDMKAVSELEKNADDITQIKARTRYKTCMVSMAEVPPVTPDFCGKAYQMPSLSGIFSYFSCASCKVDLPSDTNDLRS